jgi:hypothetical protein
MRREEDTLGCAGRDGPKAVHIGSTRSDILVFDLGANALQKLADEPGDGFLSMADGGAGRILTWDLDQSLA